jgi:DNA-binding response OmpR family regulator
MDTVYDAKLLIVDDNAELLALLCEQLRGAGYGHIRTAQSCAAARACFAAEQPELMILDINLPDGDGFSLFLSARDADADRLFGLGLGADDYLTKPFLMQELLLRVQHILQRAYRAELSRTKPAPLQLGERCVDLNDAIVTLPEGKILALTATELALLRKLAENRGHIVTYDALCAAVWGADYYGYENSLGVHIRHLREKLEAEPGAPRFLRTVRGIGYKLTKGEEA